MSTEINLIYHELSFKQIKDSGAKEVKDNFELLKKGLEILEIQFTTRIIQLVSMMDNTIIRQTEQLSRRLDEKKKFCINLWIVIFLTILQIASYKMIVLFSRLY